MLSTIAVVHNGIIENYQELKAELINRGYQFASQTDTELFLLSQLGTAPRRHIT